MTLRVLVCGGRKYRDADTLDVTLDALHRERGIAVIIHGAAPGADSLAEKWAQKRGIPYLSFPAQWHRYKQAAGPIRNQQMLDEGRPDLVVAFPGGTGTADMVRRASYRGVVVEPVK